MDINAELQHELDAVKSKLAKISNELEDISEIKDNLKSSSSSLKDASDNNNKLISEAIKLHAELSSSVESLNKSHDLFSILVDQKINDLERKIEEISSKSITIESDQKIIKLSSVISPVLIIILLLIVVFIH